MAACRRAGRRIHMEIQVKSTNPYGRERPLPDPISLLRKRDVILYHVGCGGHMSVDPGDRRDPESYSTVRCNLCFETSREKRSLVVSALNEVLSGGEPSDKCTVIRFVPLSTREILVHSPLASRLQRYFQRGSKTRQ